MELVLQIKMNETLYLRNPESTELGKNIIKHSILMIDEIGFESFTFKKLAEDIGTTEASIYRYFENKHRLLIYLVAWYWSWLEYQITFQTNNIENPKIKLEKVITLLAKTIEDDISTGYVNEEVLQRIVISEGSKSYLTKHVDEDNKFQFFKPYKDLSSAIAALISACNSNYKYPRSLATTIIEMSHSHNFYIKNLPALTDIEKLKKETYLITFLNQLVFSALV
jgi:AcrR family transcriptional regulator